MSKRKLILPICLTMTMAAISGIILGSGSVNAAPSAGVEVSANIQEFLRMALDTNSLAFEDSEGNTTISPSPSGTLASGNVNVAVTTNTDKGFTISAYTHGATTNMTNTNTDLNASISSVSTATGYDSTTGLSALPTDTWGFRKKTGENTYGNWFGVGTDESHSTVIEDTDSSVSEYCSTLAYPLNTSGCSAGTYAEHTLNFGANLTPNLPAGTYTNDVVISAVVKSNGARYMLNFDSNGGQNTMASRSIIAGSTFNLPATTNVVKEGYELVGYAFTSSAASPAYTPGQTVTVNDFLTAATSSGQDIDAGITLYLIWDLSYTLTYNAGSNGGNAATGSAISNNATLSSTVTIPGNTDDHFALEGYKFQGWALTDGATTVAYSAGDTPTMSALITAAAAAGQSVTSSTSGTINFYAVWGKTYFQTTGSCATIDVNTTGTLTDSRDEQEYTVYRFRNTGTVGNFDSGYPSDMSGYCIMTKDLSLGYVTGGSVTKGSDLTLTANDSAAAATITARTSTSNWDTTNSDSNLQYINGTDATYGTHSYYSYGAAQKVCPKGWRPPTSSEYSNIATFMGGDNSTGSSRIRSAPYNFVYGGYFYSGGWLTVGSTGAYWSSTQYDSSNGYYLFFYSSSLRANNNLDKYLGRSVRCVSAP